MIRARHPGAARALHMLAAVCMVAALGAGACTGSQRTPPLDEALRTYNDGVRWQRFTVAAAHVPAPRRDDFLDQRDQVGEDLRISEYEVIRVRYDRSGRLARVHVKFVWHLDSRGVVHTTHTVQSWQFQGKGWVLAGERHLRGQPMPGVPPRQRNDDIDDNGDDDDDTGDDIDAGDDDTGDHDGDDHTDNDNGDTGADEPAGSHGDALRMGAE